MTNNHFNLGIMASTTPP